MIATVTALVVMSVVLVLADNPDLEIGFAAPLLIDLASIYVIGAYLGVFPAV